MVVEPTGRWNNLCIGKKQAGKVWKGMKNRLGALSQHSQWHAEGFGQIPSPGSGAWIRGDQYPCSAEGHRL